MDDHGAADDAARPGRDADAVDLDVDLGAAALLRLERRQVAGVALRRARPAVRLAERIEVSLGAHAVARAAITGLVDMQAVLLAGLEALDVDDDVHLVAA